MDSINSGERLDVRDKQRAKVFRVCALTEEGLEGS